MELRWEDVEGIGKDVGMEKILEGGGWVNKGKGCKREEIGLGCCKKLRDYKVDEMLCGS